MTMRYPKLTIGLSALGAVAMGLLLTRKPGNVPSLPAGPLPFGPLPSGTTGLTSYLSDAFFKEVEKLAAYFRARGANVTGEDLLAVFLVESAGIHANVPNKLGCLGLNQICPTLDAAHDPQRVSGLRAVDFQGSVAEYLALSEAEQLKYVRKFFDNKNLYKAISDYGTLYLVNFSPAFLAPPEHPIWLGRYPKMYVDPARGGTGPLDRNYTANAGVDTGNKGYIELADMARFVKRGVLANAAKWAELRMRLDAVRREGVA